ncbi:hypothetical protein L6452_09329 [Arctium lappa]|uniref:Uncharacterized protein n=1 Tax=Arctium lappa TaxID=4217 RepID=A0ACB9DK07_ARCLA|nr:hypothetical protein L6452_09329 [Arctium lappa]
MSPRLLAKGSCYNLLQLEGRINVEMPKSQVKSEVLILKFHARSGVKFLSEQQNLAERSTRLFLVDGYLQMGFGFESDS